MLTRRVYTMAIGLAALLAACSDDGAAPDAAAPIDASHDGAEPDAALPDAALPDAALPDAAVIDAAVIDAAVIDAAMVDAAVADAAVVDAAVVDARVIDARVVDARVVDAGPVDAPVDAPPATGDLRWLRTIADLPGEQGNAGATVIRAGGGGVYVAGAFFGRAIFGAGQPNTITFTAVAPDLNGFIARYEPDGHFAWASKIGPLYSVITDAAVLPDGAVAVVGTFAWDCVDTSPIPQPTPITCTTLFGAGGLVQIPVAVTAAGTPRDNAFVAVFEATGTLRWVGWADSPSVTIFEAVTALPDGSVVVAGTSSDVTTYRRGLDSLTAGAPGEGGAALVRFAADGLPLWASHEAGTCASGYAAVTASADGASLMVAGRASRYVTPCQLQLAPGGPVAPITTSTQERALLGGFSADGTPSWTLALGAEPGDDAVWALTTTSDGDVVAVGDLAHGCVGGPCGASFPSTAGGAPAYVPQVGASFVARYGFDGVRRWARPLGGQLRGAWSHPLGATPDGGFVVATQLYGPSLFGIGDPSEVALDALCTASWGDSVLSRHAGDGALVGLSQRVCTIGEGAAASPAAVYSAGRYSNGSVFGLGTTTQTTLNAGPPPTQDEDVFITAQVP
jgi:hypothetical protein